MRDRALAAAHGQIQLGGAAGHALRPLPRAAPGWRRGARAMNDRERIAELEAKVERLERSLPNRRSSGAMPWRRATPRRTSSGRAGSSLSSSAGDAPCGWRSISRTDRDRSPGRSGGCGRPSALGSERCVRRGRATTASLRRLTRGGARGRRRHPARPGSGGPGARAAGLGRDPQPRRPRPPRALPPCRGDDCLPGRRDHRRRQRLDRWIGGPGGELRAPVPGTGHPERGEPVVLGRQRSGGGNRRRGAAVLPQQRCRADHRGLARLHGRDPDDHRRGSRRGTPDLSVTSGWIAGRSAICRPDPPASGGGVRSERGGAHAPRPGRRRRPTFRCRRRRRRAAGTDRRLSPGRQGRVRGGRGIGSAYDYGLEDVDLCLNLRAAGGHLIYDGRAALWHHESATRTADPALRRSRVARNREAYLDDWGPRIFREALLDALDDGDRFSDAPFHVAIVGAVDASGVADVAAAELGGSFSELGWRVSLPVPHADAALALDASVEAIIAVDSAVETWRTAASPHLHRMGRERPEPLAGAALVRRLRHHPRRHTGGGRPGPSRQLEGRHRGPAGAERLSRP